LGPGSRRDAMNAPFDTPIFKIYALCSAIIVFLLYALANYTATSRAKSKTKINPEDLGTLADAEHPTVLRAKRAHLNLLENAVPFFAVGFLYTWTNPSMALAQGFFYGFVGLRVAHMIFYLAGKQPFRTISFILSALIVLAMTVQVLRAAI